MTPENMLADSEIICEKLLGWIKIRPTSPLPGIDFVGWRRPTGGEQLATPSFTTWAEAGLILDALAKSDWDCQLGYCRIDEVWYCNPIGRCIEGPTGPAAICAAAIEYIRAVKS